MNVARVLFDRTAIDVAKGILILAVIVGHSEAVSAAFPWLRQALYAFHVQCFFLLSSLLDKGTPRISLAYVRDRGVRYLVPYVSFFSVCLVAWAVIHGPAAVFESPSRIGAALLTGDEATLHAAVGTRFLWFLPALFSLTILRRLFHYEPRLKNALTLASCFLIATSSSLPKGLLSGLPLGLGTALFFLALGEAARSYVHSTSTLRYNGIVDGGLFLVLSCLLTQIPLGWVAAGDITSYAPTAPMTYVVSLTIPMVALPALLRVCPRLPGCDWLASLGRLSMPIYLIHMLVYRSLQLLWFGKQHNNRAIVSADLGVGILILVFTIVLSYLTSYLLYRHQRLRSAMFPRDWREWITAFAGNRSNY